MKIYKITFEWKIYDTRKASGAYETGTSTIQTSERSQLEAMNRAIDFATALPSWELERNHIDEGLDTLVEGINDFKESQKGEKK